MATEDNNSLKARIEALGLVIGNQVLGTDKNASTPSRQMWVDSDSRLQTGTQQPFAMGATQSTVTSALLTLAGISKGGILTQTLVAGVDTTTVTKAAFIRVDVTDDNAVVTGSFYLELFTIL